MPQPQITGEHGCILTIGFMSLMDRAAVVMPIFTDDTSFTTTDQCHNAVNDAITGILPALLPIMSADANATFIQAEGMLDGYVPDRSDFGPTVHPGTGPNGILPNNTCGLITMYAEPADMSPGDRMRTAKIFIPGLPASTFDGRSFDAPTVALMQTLADLMVGGWATSGGTTKWYRGLSAIKPRAPTTYVRRISAARPREYPATQRRRLLPRS